MRPRPLSAQATGTSACTGARRSRPAAACVAFKAEDERAKMLVGVSCEACHGPGSLYSPFKKENPQFKLADIVSRGATQPPKAEECMVCHVRECPTMAKDYAFDFEKAKKSDKDLHDHIPLKFPH